jgi:hypothetical protein
MLVIFAATLTSSLLLLWLNLAGNVTLAQLQQWVVTANLPEVWTAFGGAIGGFFVQANVVLLLATLIVGVRCSGAVTGERERQTWEALLLTPLTVRHMIRGKLWGIIGASFPYLMAYFVPAALLALVAGPWAVVLVGLMLLAAWLAMLFVGASGLYCSVRARTSWRSLLGTLGISYVGSFLLIVVASPAIWILMVLIMLTCMVIDSGLGTNLARGFFGMGGMFILASYLVLLGLFGVLTYYFVRDSEKYVADRERVRHWKEEPMALPRRPQTVRPASTASPSA